MFEIVYDDDGRTDGRRLDGYTISEPNGSGELKTVDFSETIAASDMKVSRSRHLIKYM